MPCGSASSTRFIYGLHAGDGVIRYVGMSKNPDKRLEQHLREARRCKNKNRHKEAWIRKVVVGGGRIEVEILEVCNDDTWEQAEKQWIEKLQLFLTNIASGGDAPPVNREQCRINARKMMDSIDYPITRFKRYLKRTATECGKAGNMAMAERLLNAWITVDMSTGKQREAFRELATRILGNGKQKSTA